MDPLLASSPLVLDGGLGMELSTVHGFKSLDDDPLWNARLLSTNVDALKTVHHSFLDNGADVIETSSYQASIDGFKEHLGLSSTDAYDLIVKSGHLAVAVRDKFWETAQSEPGRVRPLVAGSVGPYGACLHDRSEYTGTYVDKMTVEELADWHRPRIQALLESGVDLLAIETIPAIKEAQALCDLLSKEFPQSKAWMSFSCKDGQHICKGEKFSDAVSSVSQCQQVIAVGVNCTAPKHILDLIKSVPTEVKQTRGLVVYPNSAQTWTEDYRWEGDPDSRPVHDYVSDWLTAGVTMVGGCCCVSSADIADIRRALCKYKQDVP